VSALTKNALSWGLLESQILYYFPHLAHKSWGEPVDDSVYDFVEDYYTKTFNMQRPGPPNVERPSSRLIVNKLGSPRKSSKLIVDVAYKELTGKKAKRTSKKKVK